MNTVLIILSVLGSISLGITLFVVFGALLTALYYTVAIKVMSWF